MLAWSLLSACLFEEIWTDLKATNGPTYIVALVEYEELRRGISHRDAAPEAARATKQKASLQVNVASVQSLEHFNDRVTSSEPFLPRWWALCSPLVA